MQFLKFLKLFLIIFGGTIGGVVLLLMGMRLYEAIADRLRPKWKHSDPHVRLSVVDRIADDATLAEIAEKDPSPDVRRRAAAGLIDPFVLARLASSADDAVLRYIAAKRLEETNPRFQFPSGGGLATAHVFAQRVFAELAAAAMDQKMRELAVDALTDQNVIAALARTPMLMCRQAVIAKLTDQAVLAELAMKKDDNLHVRLAAAERLTDVPLAQAAFRAIATEAKDANVRLAAADKLKDRRGAADVDSWVATARDFENPGIAQTALKKITSQDVLAKVAANAEDDKVAQEALDRITDQQWISHVAQGWVRFSSVRAAAVKKLGSGAMDALIASLPAKDGDVRKAAALKALQDKQEPRLIAAIERQYVYEDDTEIVRIFKDVLGRMLGPDAAQLVARLETERRKRVAESMRIRHAQEASLSESKRRADRQERCHYQWQRRERGFCSVCQSDDWESTCRSCGATQRHVCT